MMRCKNCYAITRRKNCDECGFNNEEAKDEGPRESDEVIKLRGVFNSLYNNIVELTKCAKEAKDDKTKMTCLTMLTHAKNSYMEFRKEYSEMLPQLRTIPASHQCSAMDAKGKCTSMGTVSNGTSWYCGHHYFKKN